MLYSFQLELQLQWHHHCHYLENDINYTFIGVHHDHVSYCGQNKTIYFNLCSTNYVDTDKHVFPLATFLDGDNVKKIHFPEGNSCQLIKLNIVNFDDLGMYVLFLGDVKVFLEGK